MLLNRQFLAGALISASISGAGAQDFCGDVLNSNVFNTSDTSIVLRFASSFKTAMCDEEWKSEEDISNRAKGFGLSFKDLTRSIGLNSSSVNDSQKRKESYNLFCSKTDEQIAYSSEFFQKYKNSDYAVKAWSDCIQTRPEGHFAAIIPDVTLSGAIVTMNKRSSGSVPPLSIQSIQSVPDKSIQCYYGNNLAENATYPDGTREISITCQKQANIPVSFNINTNWGVFDNIRVQGYSQELQAIQLDIARLNQKISELEQAGFVRASQLQSAADNAGFIRFGSSLSIRDSRAPNVALSRHGAGGNFVSPYPDTTVLDGAQASRVWILRKE